MSGMEKKDKEIFLFNTMLSCAQDKFSRHDNNLVTQRKFLLW